MHLLGIEIGTSSVKVSVVNPATTQTVATTRYPDLESEIIAQHSGWAAQSPELWGEQVKYNPADIAAIGFANPMHGLVAIAVVAPRQTEWYNNLYENWKKILERKLAVY